MPARITPKAGEEKKYEWIQTVNLAKPGGEPRPAVLYPGLLQQLSVKRWITRRVFVREPWFSDHSKFKQRTNALRNYVQGELSR
jgi:hypothetical protein